MEFSIGFTDQGVEAHNKLRKIHAAPPLKADYEMSKEAEEWAKKLAEQDNLEHSTGKYGENLAMACKPENEEVTAPEATKMW